MAILYVADTNAVINHFAEVFGQSNRLSPRAQRIMQAAFGTTEGDVRLSIPAVVFVEIYDKWNTDEERVRRIFFEVFSPACESPNIEIKPIEREVLENLILLGGTLDHHEIHDKIIFASAMMLECSLISTDGVLLDYNSAQGVLPEVIS
jgi:PIN domain nuclease of toxin-antitoxin system